MEFRRDESAAAESAENKKDNLKLKLTEFFLPLLLGESINAQSEKSADEKAATLGIIREHENFSYRVTVTKIESAADLHPSDEELVRFCDSVLKKHFNAQSFYIGGYVVSVLFISEENDYEQLQNALSMVRRGASSLFSMSCKIGVSRVKRSFLFCSPAYCEAKAAVNYAALSENEIRYFDYRSYSKNFRPVFVEQCAGSLEELLKSGTEEELKCFIKSLFGDKNRQSIYFAVMQLLSGVYRTVSTTLGNDNVFELISSSPVYLKASVMFCGDNAESELCELCLNAKRIIRSRQKHDSRLLCDKAVSIIENEFKNEALSLTGISSRLNVTPNYLSALIKKAKGKTFISLLTERRMKEAYDLVTCSSKKMTEIAESCGYSDQHYFGCCFKKYYGISPGRMRKNIRYTAENG